MSDAGKKKKQSAHHPASAMPPNAVAGRTTNPMTLFAMEDVDSEVRGGRSQMEIAAITCNKKYHSPKGRGSNKKVDTSTLTKLGYSIGGTRFWCSKHGSEIFVTETGHKAGLLIDENK